MSDFDIDPKLYGDWLASNDKCSGQLTEEKLRQGLDAINNAERTNNELRRIVGLKEATILEAMAREGKLAHGVPKLEHWNEFVKRMWGP